MYAPWAPEIASSLILAHDGEDGALLPILHDIQHTFGCVPAEAVGLIAQALNLSRADVHGVVSFYPDFRAAPPGRTHVKLCQAEACQARGSRALTRWLEGRLGAKLGETRSDGAVTLEAIYCLGLCASGPAALINDRPHARLDEQALDALVSDQLT